MAEEYFNARARELRIDWRADSRALVPDLNSLGNVGSMSSYARRMLEKAGVHINKGNRYPLSVSESDLSDAEIVIALSRTEHQEMFADLHPQHYNEARFWDVEDIDLEAPDDAFDKVVKHTEALLRELGGLTRR